MSAPDPLLSIPNAAKYLDCSKNTVYRLIADGELDVVDIAPRRSRRSKSRVPQSQLDALIKSRKRTAVTLRAVNSP